MINFLFPNSTFIEGSSRWGSDIDSGDDGCLEKSVNDHGDDRYAPWCSSGFRDSWIWVIALTPVSPLIGPYFSPVLLLVPSTCSRFR